MSSSEELQYIYSTLRRVKCIEKFESNASLKANVFSFDASLFPKIFLLKSIDERLEDIEELAEEFCRHLFKQIGGRPKQIDKEELKQTKTDATVQRIFDKNVKYPDLDEYFHSSLYYLHDFLIDINWHEADLDILSKADLAYVNNNLKFFQAFLAFQKVLNNLILQTRQSPVSTKAESSPAPGWFVRRLQSAGSSSPGGSQGAGSQQKALKSSLSLAGLDKPRVDSPAARRRVRFKVDETTIRRKNRAIKSTSTRETQQIEYTKQSAVDERDLRENHSILAFNLLLYSMNIFIQQLSNKLVEWLESNDIIESLNLLTGSKQKLRTAQLVNVAKKIKVSNDVYLTVLEYLAEIKQTYLIENIHNTLIAKDSKRLYDLYKVPRINIYMKKIGQDVESKILVRLVNQNLQIVLDLIVSDINLPPVELDGQTKTKTRDQIARGTDNILNFVTNWFGIDDVLFGFSKPTKKDSTLKVSQPDQQQQQQQRRRNDPMAFKESTLSLGVQFKSNSRILNQMDNLIELIRNLLKTILDRIRGQQQMDYLLRLFLAGMEGTFGSISSQLIAQIEQINESKGPERTNKDLDADSITIKVRCLKLIHIMTSTNELLKQFAINSKVDINFQPFEKKLHTFQEVCSKQTSSKTVKI